MTFSTLVNKPQLVLLEMVEIPWTVVPLKIILKEKEFNETGFQNIVAPHVGLLLSVCCAVFI